MGLTEELDTRRRRIVLIQSLITASVVAIIFLALGPKGLRLVGITIPDFMIAGGIALLVIAFSDLVTGEKRQRQADLDTLGAVPIGVPLITVPAVLTTSILLVDAYGIIPTALAVLVNIGIAVVIFWFAGPISALLGDNGSRVLSKIASLFLAAIAVMLIRKGIFALITDYLK